MITLQDLEAMFAKIRAETNWNVDGDMLWSYFFTDRDPEKLASAVEPLCENGYECVGIYETDHETDHENANETAFFLHVERIETHTPQTLHALNAALYAFAEEYGLESYGGMDVCPADGSHGGDPDHDDPQDD